MAENEASKPSIGEDGARLSAREALEAAMSQGDFAEQLERRVVTHQLPDDLAAFADRYEEVVGIRDRFVWKWFHLLCPSFRLSTVGDQHGSTVRAHKTLLTLYVTLLDDLLEARGDRATFRRGAAFPFDGEADPEEADLADFTEEVDVEYLALTRDVWRAVEESIDAAPHSDRWDELFRFDLRQVLNSIRYAYVATSHEHLANMTETYAFGSHNMVMFPYADVDLMHASGFDRAELPELRQLLWHAQQMARIGNWVSTWERELSEYDYSSGVVVRALDRGVVTRDELLAARDDPDQMQKVRVAIEAAGIETELLEEWATRYEYLAKTVDLESVDGGTFLDGMENVLRFQLGSRGLK